MLEALFESEKKEKILFFLYPHGDGYARDIARTFQFNLNTVQNQLLKLESYGVLFSRLKGRVRLFGFNPRYPFKKELEALLCRSVTPLTRTTQGKRSLITRDRFFIWCLL